MIVVQGLSNGPKGKIIIWSRDNFNFDGYLHQLISLIFLTAMAGEYLHYKTVPLHIYIDIYISYCVWVGRNVLQLFNYEQQRSLAKFDPFSQMGAKIATKFTRKL